MLSKREFKKYRKNALKEIHYQNVYADGVIETKPGYFTKMYRCLGSALAVFDLIHRFYLSEDAAILDYKLNEVDAQITYFEGSYYLTIGTEQNSYESSLVVFDSIDPNEILVVQLSFDERMSVLHAMYQNDDKYEDRFNKFSYRKKDKKPPVEFKDYMKNFKKNKKISKDLILPFEMYENSTEFEFEGNYIRYFYLKNTPRYLTREFLEEMESIENVCFSIHFKPLDQTQIVEYVQTKFEVLKDLKRQELLQKQFFESATPELKKSAKRNEEMFLITMVLGVANDSIDDLNYKVKNLVREFEKSYVVKELKFQQKNSLQTFLPFCEDRLDVKTTIYKKRETV